MDRNDIGIFEEIKEPAKEEMKGRQVGDKITWLKKMLDDQPDLVNRWQTMSDQLEQARLRVKELEVELTNLEADMRAYGSSDEDDGELGDEGDRA